MTITTPSALLRAARETISKPENWCAQTIRLNSKRHSTSSALWLADAADDLKEAAYLFLMQAIQEDNPRLTCLADFNDSVNRTHAEVLAVYDRAIEMAEGEK